MVSKKDELIRKEIANRLRVFADLVEVDEGYTLFSPAGSYADIVNDLTRDKVTKPVGMPSQVNISAKIENPTTHDVVEIYMSNIPILEAFYPTNE